MDTRNDTAAAGPARIEGLLDLTGQVALVTGAGQGIGLGIARMLSAHGATVAINDFVAERAEEAAQAIEKDGGRALAAPGDITDFRRVLSMVEAVESKAGRLDILVNNAGNAGSAMQLGDFQPFWETDPEEWQNWLGTNLFGVMHGFRAVLPRMIERKHGRIVTITSDAGRVGEPHLATYSCAKAGAAGLTRALAKAVGRHGITANCISMGGVDTPGAKSILVDDEAVQRMLKRYVIRRVGTATDAAAMTLFLVSEAGSWITGQTYPVNGGYSFAS